MKKFTSLQEVEAELLAHAPNRMYAVNYKLVRVRAILEAVNNPHHSLKVIHITGTSGKTSTAYYVRDLLEASGKRTGLTVSPHITSTCERLQIDGGPISERKFVTYFQEFFAVVEHIEPRPTYFELLTAFVYYVFAKEKVDYVVIEVGLGGKYDATNVITARDKVCIINSIGYDHTEILGETLTEIASEKAGIIQSGNVVFSVEQEPEAQIVIEHEVQKRQAELFIIKPVLAQDNEAPLFQQKNFSLALEAVRYVARRDGFSLVRKPETVLRRTQVPGRFEQYRIGKKLIILDGAHNPQKLSALLESLRAQDIHSATVVAAFSEAPKKKIDECLEILNSFADQTNFTKFSVQRDVMRHSADLSGEKNFYENPEDAFRNTLRDKVSCIVVTGSLYLVSVIRPFVQSLSASVS